MKTWERECCHGNGCAQNEKEAGPEMVTSITGLFYHVSIWNKCLRF